MELTVICANPVQQLPTQVELIIISRKKRYIVSALTVLLLAQYLWSIIWNDIMQYSLFNRSRTRKRESWIRCFCISFSFYILLNKDLNALKFRRRQLKSSWLWLCLFCRFAFVMLVQSRFVICSCQIKIRAQNIKTCSGYYYTSLNRTNPGLHEEIRTILTSQPGLV